MTPEEYHRVVYYGVCYWCGSPRDIEQVSTMGGDGRWSVTLRGVCTGDPTHGFAPWPDPSPDPSS